jgi:hypothetical protein
MSNESVGKVLLTSENDVFGGHLTLPNHEIVDCDAFYEVTFFYISPKDLLGNFFYSLNNLNQRCAIRIRWIILLGELFLVLGQADSKQCGEDNCYRRS